MKENEEILMEKVSPEDLPSQEEQQEKEPYVPSPRWKRNLAWVLFGVLVAGIFCWLMNMAFPTWIDTVRSWF